MKANEFVKKFGLLRTKEVLKYSDKHHVSLFADSISTTYLDYCADGSIPINDLECIIKSFGVVESYGGLVTAVYIRNRNLVLPEFMLELKQSIKDVESCQ